VQRVYFCTGTSFLTGDRIASSLLSYLKALGQTEEFDVVEVPTLRNDGSAGRTTLMLSPASQVSAEWLVADADTDEVTDEALVADLDAKAAHLLGPHSPRMETAGYIPFAMDELD
jgi:hypothetical protein